MSWQNIKSRNLLYLTLDMWVIPYQGLHISNTHRYRAGERIKHLPLVTTYSGNTNLANALVNNDKVEDIMTGIGISRHTYEKAFRIFAAWRYEWCRANRPCAIAAIAGGPLTSSTSVSDYSISWMCVAWAYRLGIVMADGKSIMSRILLLRFVARGSTTIISPFTLSTRKTCCWPVLS